MSQDIPSVAGRQMNVRGSMWSHECSGDLYYLPRPATEYSSYRYSFVLDEQGVVWRDDERLSLYERVENEVTIAQIHQLKSEVIRLGMRASSMRESLPVGMRIWLRFCCGTCGSETVFRMSDPKSSMAFVFTRSVGTPPISFLRA